MPASPGSSTQGLSESSSRKVRAGREGRGAGRRRLYQYTATMQRQTWNFLSRSRLGCGLSKALPESIAEQTETKQIRSLSLFESKYGLRNPKTPNLAEQRYGSHQHISHQHQSYLSHMRRTCGVADPTLLRRLPAALRCPLNERAHATQSWRLDRPSDDHDDGQVSPSILAAQGSNPAYQAHIPLNVFQRGSVAMLSAFGAVAKCVTGLF